MPKNDIFPTERRCLKTQNFRAHSIPFSTAAMLPKTGFLRIFVHKGVFRRTCLRESIMPLNAALKNIRRIYRQIVEIVLVHTLSAQNTIKVYALKLRRAQCEH